MTANHGDNPGPGLQSQPVFSRGIVAGIIALVAVVLIIVGAFLLMGGTPSVPAVPADVCAQQAIAYIDKNIPANNSTPSSVVSVSPQHDTYEITILYNGRNTKVYASKDCSLLFTKTYTMNASGSAAPATVTASPSATPAAPPKSARPTVDLYVMAFCPYGVQAETAIRPVVALLGAHADFRVHYIATVKNSTVEGIRSLHGLSEAKEDLRQLCVMKYYPDTFWSYVEGINTRCYPLYQNADKLDACWKNVSVLTGTDPEKITACAYSAEGVALLKADETLSLSKGITGSPTLLINGQRYSGQRTAEAYKQAICASFGTPPAQCSTVLAGQQSGQAPGSCG